MRQALQRQCGFEALESMTLLSGSVAFAFPDSNPAPLPIHLTGSISEIYTTKKFSGLSFGTWALLTFPVTKGSGSISPLGDVTESGEPALTQVYLKAETGMVSFVISRPTDEWPGRSTIRKFFAHAGNVITGEYTIGGGTGAYAGATGSGNMQITTLGHDKFTETLS
jgi:hypothetical protein